MMGKLLNKEDKSLLFIFNLFLILKNIIKLRF